jgi:choline-sulfatase
VSTVGREGPRREPGCRLVSERPEEHSVTVCFRRIAIICLVGAFLTGCGQEDRPDPAEAAKQPAVFADRSWPNVLLITIDSLRADHLHCYGYPRETSPQIDRLAAEGALFEAAISSSCWTLPAHASMFTGLAASVHGCEDTKHQLHSAHTTLAERLKNTGFATAAFVSSLLLDPIFGLSQGFGQYVHCTAPLPGNEVARTYGATSPTVVATVQGWLRQNTQRPFFLFVNFWDVHFDYTPPPPFDTTFDPDYQGELTGAGFLTDPRINPNMPQRDLDHLKALYDGEIAWVDQHVGQILDAFRAAGLLDSTVVILTSSHGTAFFEHGQKGHRNSLYDEVIRVPLLVRYPARVPAGQRYREQARGMDLLPTITDLLGMPSSDLMGRSLAPLFTGKSIDVRGGKETAISELTLSGRTLLAFRQPERKTIFNVQMDRGAVYDLVADPGELAALADPESRTVEGARADSTWSRAFLKAYRQRYPRPPEIPELPARVQEKLSALGYVDGAPPDNAPAP